MDWNFFTSYIRCLTTSWLKLLSTLQCFTACGEFIGTLPTHSLYKLPMKRFTISKIFFDHLDLIHLNWVISQGRNNVSHKVMSDKLFSMLQCSLTWLPPSAGLQKRQSKKTLLLTPAGMQWTTWSSPSRWLKQSLWSSTSRIKKSSQKTSKLLYSMASVAIKAVGTVPNAVAFIGRNDLTHLFGDDPKYALEEKKDLTKLSRLTKPLMLKTKKKERSCLSKSKELAKQNFINTDHTFKLYNRMHQDEPLMNPSEPRFSNFYQPSALQKQGELIFVRISALVVGYTAFWLL